MNRLLNLLSWLVILLLFIMTAFQIDGWFYWSGLLFGVLLILFSIRLFRKPITSQKEEMFQLNHHELQNKKFKRSFIGYDVDEVNDFLDHIIKQYEGAEQG